MPLKSLDCLAWIVHALAPAVHGRRSVMLTLTGTFGAALRSRSASWPLGSVLIVPPGRSTDRFDAT